MMVSALAVIASCAGEPKLTPSQVGSKWGYVNPKGELVIEPAFEAAENFSGDLAKVVLNGKVGYIGTDGLFRVTADYLDGTTFFEDKAYVIAPGETPSKPVFTSYTKIAPPAIIPDAGLVINLVVQGVDAGLGSTYQAAWEAIGVL